MTDVSFMIVIGFGCLMWGLYTAHVYNLIKALGAPTISSRARSWFAAYSVIGPLWWIVAGLITAAVAN